jgi:hypothetical protein
LGSNAAQAFGLLAGFRPDGFNFAVAQPTYDFSTYLRCRQNAVLLMLQPVVVG